MKRIHRNISLLQFESPSLLEEVLQAAGLKGQFLVVRLSPVLLAVPKEDLEAVQQELRRKGYYPTKARGEDVFRAAD
ncbi:MAG: hypothetical protein ACLFVK_06150 [Dehalococcoidia bacterium]